MPNHEEQEDIFVRATKWAGTDLHQDFDSYESYDDWQQK